MSHWLLETLGDTRAQALRQASHAQIYRELLNRPFNEDAALIERTGEALEMAVMDMLLEGTTDDETKLATLKSCAADAFRLYRVLPETEDVLEASMFKLRSSALAVLGDMGSDAALKYFSYLVPLHLGCNHLINLTSNSSLLARLSI